ncbi:MAG: hypothetical protein JXA97_12495 [Anaerolineales bacterium]|nr:hypothetical protein [Anaerolineales bacterium]
MGEIPLSVGIGRGLILLNALIWLAFALFLAAGLHPALPDDGITRWVMAALSLMAGTAEFGLLMIIPGSRLAYCLLLALLSLIAVLSVADEVGLADLIVLLLTLAPIVLLHKDRRWYLSQSKLPPAFFGVDYSDTPAGRAS